MSLELYVFETAEGGEDFFTTIDPAEAKEYAQQHGLRCIARIFEFSDSEVVWDFTDLEKEEGDWQRRAHPCAPRVPRGSRGAMVPTRKAREP